MIYIQHEAMLIFQILDRWLKGEGLLVLLFNKRFFSEMNYRKKKKIPSILKYDYWFSYQLQVFSITKQFEMRN